MERIQFSEVTNRLHRNLVAIAAIIIVMVLFHLRITKAVSLGFEIENLTNGALIIILVGVLIYHAVAFSVRAFEEYRLWELKFTAKQASYYGGGIGVIELADQLKDLADTLKRVSRSVTIKPGSDTAVVAAQFKGSTFNSEDIRKLTEAASAAQTYGKRLKIFL